MFLSFMLEDLRLLFFVKLHTTPQRFTCEYLACCIFWVVSLRIRAGLILNLKQTNKQTLNRQESSFVENSSMTSLTSTWWYSTQTLTAWAVQVWGPRVKKDSISFTQPSVLYVRPPTMHPDSFVPFCCAPLTCFAWSLSPSDEECDMMSLFNTSREQN